MATVNEVPLRNDLFWYHFITTFSGVKYTVHIRYNTRMNRYMMDLNDASDNPILSGIPVLIQRNLTGQYSTLSIPAGTFVATDDTGNENQPTQFSFGLNHTLYYIDPTQGT